MKLREWIWDHSYGNNLVLFWKFFWLRERVKNRWGKLALTLCLNRMAHKRGGYIGCTARIDGKPILPHGLHGIYISRYAHIGKECRIYQNVTVGEVNHQAPTIGDRCLIGANACLIGNITIGDDVKIGAGAVVAEDVPAGSTVVAQKARVLAVKNIDDMSN